MIARDALASLQKFVSLLIFFIVTCYVGCVDIQHVTFSLF